MRRIAAAAVALPLLLAGCGGDDDGDGGDGGDVVATDPASTTATSEPSPTASPTVGTYPSFGPEDYTYELVVICFCMGSGVPIEVTVAGDEVKDAVYTADDPGRSGVKAGDPAPETFWLTIDDVIDAANNTEAAVVDVQWPAGQDYPSGVYLDVDKNTVDDEIGYEIDNVEVG